MSTAVKRPTNGSLETRAIGGVELRAEGQGDEMSLVGYAASFGVVSQDLGGFREIIAPGAFSRSLKDKADVKALVNHDPNKLLGRTKSGTLQLEEDYRGLKFRCQLDRNNSEHMNLYASIKRGDMDECSFAFRVPDGGDEWKDVRDNQDFYSLRTLRTIDLMDVSAVTYPAYSADGATVVNARSVGRARLISATNGPDYRLHDPWSSERARLKALDDAFDKRTDESHRRMAAAISREIAAGK